MKSWFRAEDKKIVVIDEMGTYEINCEKDPGQVYIRPFVPEYVKTIEPKDKP